MRYTLQSVTGGVPPIPTTRRGRLVSACFSPCQKLSYQPRTRVAQRSDRLWLSNVLFVTVPELAVTAVTANSPAEGSAIDREGDDVAVVGNDRLHAHACETCDWRWNALVDRSAKPQTMLDY